MYGRADGMPSFQLPVAVSACLLNLLGSCSAKEQCRAYRRRITVAASSYLPSQKHETRLGKHIRLD